jgi:hypothetical protein
MYTVEELKDKLQNLSEEDVVSTKPLRSYDIESIIRYTRSDLVTHIFGLPFEAVDDYRDYSCYYWVFKLGDKFYRYCGSYDSWGGTEFYHDLHECEKVTKTIEEWVDK